MMGTEVVTPEAFAASKINENQDVEEFIRDHVAALFDERLAFRYEESAKFGELMRNADARLLFAKYIDARRGSSKCLGEITFYKLLHSFALVLFECTEADNFKPGKILMNMSFTYYYVPNGKQAALEKTLQFMSTKSIGGKKENSSKIKVKNSYAGKMMRNVGKTLGSCIEALREYGIVVNTVDEKEKLKNETLNPQGNVCLKEKYLYEYLKNQPIWKSDRFWEEAFFTAVASEREKRCTLRSCGRLNPDERQKFEDTLANITFGQLGTFINNMICLGIPKEIVREFLGKHAVIGGIGMDGDLYKMLVDLIDSRK